MQWIYAVLFALRLAYWIFKCVGGCGEELKMQKGQYPKDWHYIPKKGGWLCPHCYSPEDLPI